MGSLQQTLPASLFKTRTTPVSGKDTLSKSLPGEDLKQNKSTPCPSAGVQGPTPFQTRLLHCPAHTTFAGKFKHLIFCSRRAFAPAVPCTWIILLKHLHLSGCSPSFKVHLRRYGPPHLVPGPCDWIGLRPPLSVLGTRPLELPHCRRHVPPPAQLVCLLVLFSNFFSESWDPGLIIFL